MGQRGSAARCFLGPTASYSRFPTILATKLLHHCISVIRKRLLKVPPAAYEQIQFLLGSVSAEVAHQFKTLRMISVAVAVIRGKLHCWLQGRSFDFRTVSTVMPYPILMTGERESA